VRDNIMPKYPGLDPIECLAVAVLRQAIKDAQEEKWRKEVLRLLREKVLDGWLALCDIKDYTFVRNRMMEMISKKKMKTKEVEYGRKTGESESYSINPQGSRC